MMGGSPESPVVKLSFKDWKPVSFRPVVLNQGPPPTPTPWGHLAKSGDILVATVGRCIWNLVGRGQGCS